MLRKTRRSEYRASKCRTCRPTLNARGACSTKRSVAFNAVEVELRRARFRRAHQVHVRVGVSETRQILIHKNVSIRIPPLRQLRCNERNTKITETNHNSISTLSNPRCRGLREILLRKDMQCAILPLRAQTKGEYEYNSREACKKSRRINRKFADSHLVSKIHCAKGPSFDGTSMRSDFTAAF